MAVRANTRARHDYVVIRRFDLEWALPDEVVAALGAGANLALGGPGGGVLSAEDGERRGDGFVTFVWPRLEMGADYTLTLTAQGRQETLFDSTCLDPLALSIVESTPGEPLRHAHVVLSGDPVEGEVTVRDGPLEVPGEGIMRARDELV